MEHQKVEGLAAKPVLPTRAILPEQMKWPLGGAAVVILVLVVVGPQIEDKTAQTILGLFTAFITTFVSVLATYHSAKNSARDELQRYGVLAWRHLDALQVKIRLESARGATPATLEAWDVDVDQAKWAWLHLVREAAESQQRLQEETDEVVLEFKRRMKGATKPEERLELQAEKQIKLARLAAASPLPLRVPTDVNCPNCTKTVVVTLGPSPGETATTKCPNCGRLFHANRGADGSILIRKHGGSPPSPGGRPTSPSGLGAIKLIHPTTHLAEMRLVADIFSAAPENRVRDWSDFKIQLQAGLSASGLDAQADARIHQLLFRLRAFQLHGIGNGISLAVDPAGLVELIEERIIVATGFRDARLLNAVLYNGNEERLRAIEALIRRVLPEPPSAAHQAPPQ